MRARRHARGVCITMKRETFLIPSTDVQRDRVTRLEDKKRGWRIRSSTLLNSQLRRNYSPLQKLRS